MALRITTWNVNGIRNPFGYQPWSKDKTFNAMFDILDADIVIMQELKIQRKDLRDDMVLVPGWDCYFSLPKHKKGYSGVGIYTRQSKCAPIRAEEGLLGVLTPPGSSTSYRDLPENEAIGGYPTASQIADLGVDPAALDAEGRCLVLEFPAFVLFGVYSPANSNGLRDDFRYGFICALDTRIRNLAKRGKRVILTGDLNVSREEIDTAKAAEAIQKEGLTREEYLNTPNRRIFNQLIEGGKVPGGRDEGREQPVLWDICREFHPDREGMFTHWEQKINARPGNFGSRIDFILCSIEMKTWFSESNIQEGLMGSDHCPVYAVMRDEIELNGERTHLFDIINPPGMFKDGKRLREFSATKDLLPLSGKLLPEFDRRRSIKDMFTRKPSSKSAAHDEDLALAKRLQEQENNGSSADQIPTAIAANPEESKSLPKRRLPTSPGKPVKRSKSNLGTSSIQDSNKQKSLKGFFVPKSPKANAPLGDSTKSPSTPDSKPSLAYSPNSSKRSKTAINHPSNSQVGSGAPSTPPASRSVSTPTPNPSQPDLLEPPPSPPFIDPEASKVSWTKLFSKRPPPRCEGHQEPCISLTTKKSGVNCGRQFWICARPLGPSGQKETGTQWRCGTFIWASDWNTSTSNGKSGS